MPAETTAFKLPYPLETDKPPSVPDDMKSLAERTDELLAEIALAQLVAGAGNGGKLVIVSSGAAAYKAMSGDATISEAGALTIGNEKVTAAKLETAAVTAPKLGPEAVEPAKIKALAVEEGKIKDGAATSRKVKPTVAEQKASTTSQAMTESFALIAGLKYEITPAVASNLLIDVTLTVQMEGSASELRINFYNNGTPFYALSGKEGLAAEGDSFGGDTRVIHHRIVMPLTAEAHTIEVKGRDSGGGASIKKETSNMVTQLFAA